MSGIDDLTAVGSRGSSLLVEKLRRRKAAATTAATITYRLWDKPRFSAAIPTKPLALESFFAIVGGWPRLGSPTPYLDRSF